MPELDLLSLSCPTATEVAAPLVVDTPADCAWDDETDVLVVGYGLAGACAALRAAELGTQDIVLADRFVGGGTSALSGGVIYAGGGTRVQRELGFQDSPEALADYLQREAGALVSRATIERFAQQSASMVDWLTQHGVCFSGPFAAKKTSYPPPLAYLYYSGNEQVPAFQGAHPPAPRGHRARATEPQDQRKFSGEVLMKALKSAIARTPAVRLRTQTAARRLIVDRNGRVLGAELWQLPPDSRAARWHQRLYAASKAVALSMTGLSAPAWQLIARLERRHAQPVRMRARQGVLLSTGGYIHHRPLVERLAPVYARAGSAGSPGDDGSALRLACGLGAQTAQLQQLSAWRFVNPPSSWMKGVIVSQRGERIVNEEQYGARLGDALFQRAQGKAWLIVDDAIQRAARKDLSSDELWSFQRWPARLSMWLCRSAPTLPALERKLGLPSGSLMRVVDDYNGAISTSAPDPMGKSDAQRAAIAQGPFHAIDMSCDNPVNPVGAITLGGLAVDELSGAVCDAQGHPIPGLYAAGRAAVGLCSANYVSGLALADCVFSGWRAAEALARTATPSGRKEAPRP